MLVIRLSRHGRKNLAFYRVVLSEHTKPVKYGYQEVLGSYDPLNHIFKADVEAIIGWIKKGAKPSERLAKLLLKETKNELFNKFIEHRERKGLSKDAEAAAEQAAKEEASKKEEAPKEEVKKEEAPKEEVKKEEAPKEETKAEEAPKEETKAEEAK